MSSTWTAITLDELHKEIETGLSKMSPRERILWSFLRVIPQKWALHPWGDEGGGFWVVAIGGETCIYYNDIEDGFNMSRFARHGVIDDYFCNHDQLHWLIHRMVEAIDSGTPCALPNAGEPTSLML